jgi:hypothetical protein
MTKYESLVAILDQLCKEAPIEYKRYYPLDNNIEGINQARARAYIHLFLKVKFGLLDFQEREDLITDETDDGGIDAYYIDSDNNMIYFVQSKFRCHESNFKEKEISVSELLAMDADRIVDGQSINEQGHCVNESGKSYNHKIQKMVKRIQNIPDIAKYDYEIIILANLKNVPPAKLRHLSGGFRCVVYDYEKTYNDLVFPIASGTFYNAKELRITLNLSSNSSNAEISYTVETDYKDCEITVLFVPTKEIAKTLYKFKNSILKYNPRSYLDLASGSVNNLIANTIIRKTSNEFAIYNNGITMLSDGTALNKKIARKDMAQLIVENPQIINGGQTAYTLSILYDRVLKGELEESIFDSKEVLLKIITFNDSQNEDQDKKLTLIEAISKATNQQTPVTEADRRSNDKIQIELQQKIFNEFGLFYERKSGEFGDGLRNKYIERTKIIDRVTLLRLAMACNGSASQARSKGENTIFKQSTFDSILSNSDDFLKYVFAYMCYSRLNEISKTFDKDSPNKDGTAQYGYGLRYGKFAIISACVRYFDDSIKSSEYPIICENLITLILGGWKNFEKYVSELPINRSYFIETRNPDNGEIIKYQNFDGYYKGTTVNNNIQEYSFLANATIF